MDISVIFSPKFIIYFWIVWFRPTTQSYGIRDQLGVDCVNKFSLVYHIEDDFQKYRTNLGRKPYFMSKSIDVRQRDITYSKYF